MKKKAIVVILAIVFGLFILYNLLKNICSQKGNKIIPSSSVFSAIKSTQNSHK